MARLSLGRPSVKVLVVSTVVVGLAGLAAASLMQVLQLRPQLGEKQRLIQTLTAQNQQLQQELAGLQTGRQDLEARLKDARKELLSTTTELGRLRAAVAEVQGRYDGLASEHAGVEARVTELARERDAAQEQVHRLEQDKLDLERVSGRLRNRFALLDRDYQRLIQRLEAAEQKGAIAATMPNTFGAAAPGTQRTLSPATSRVSATRDRAGTFLAGDRAGKIFSGEEVSAAAGLPTEGVSQHAGAGTTTQMAATSAPPAWGVPQTVELPPIIVRKDQAAVASVVQGMVVEVNEAQQFVVVNEGSQDGILLGMILDVVRGTARVGRVKVVRVRPKMSACDIIRSDTVDPLQVGDTVAQQSW